MVICRVVLGRDHDSQSPGTGPIHRSKEALSKSLVGCARNLTLGRFGTDAFPVALG